MQSLNRHPPAGPAAAYRTFAITSPLATHFRPATCAEVDCPHYLNGWTTAVPAGSKDEAVIRRAGRHFTEQRQGEGFIQFTFPGGQPCFRAATHRVSLQRPENFLVLGGDFRGNPLRTPAIQHRKPEFWVENFQDDLDRMTAAKERG